LLHCLLPHLRFSEALLQLNSTCHPSLSSLCHVFDIQGHFHPPSWCPSSFEVVLILPGHPIACICPIIPIGLIVYLLQASICNCTLLCTKLIYISQA
jgi:hypothetical protein